MRGRIFQLVGVCAGVAVLAALAQTTPAPAPSSSPTPRAAEESRPRSVETPTPDAEERAEGRPLTPREAELDTESATMMQPEEQAVSEEAVAAEEPSLLPEDVRKRWRIIPLFSAGVVYDDNIFLTNENRVADVIWNISAGLAFELGDFRGKGENYLTGYWLGIPLIYTNNPEQNAFNYSAALIGQYRWNRLVARLQSTFDNTTGPSREVNTIVATRSFSNALRFQYDYSEKTSFDLQFAQSHSESSDPAGPTSEIVSGQTTTDRYETKAGVNYQMFPKTNVGFEAAAGILDQSSSVQYYQQARVRLNYVATGKLNLKFTGGADVREFRGSDLIKITPVFSLGFDYRPFEGTTVGVVGFRNVNPATDITGQDITATGFEIAVSQRVFQKFIAAVSFGYENDVYSSIGNAPPTDRVDNYVYVRPRLSYSFVEWLSASVFYEFRQTESTDTESSFYNNRVGMEVGLRF